MDRSQGNKILFFLSLVMLINSLGYGIIIPLLYPYAERFGFTPLTLSLLFASFSLAQFIATPIIGRYSDRVGRKPMLLGSLLGTSVSLAMLAVAPNAIVLFAARILDGVTGGNISVAQAIIADISDQKERARRFGLLGAMFGFGFLIGPAIGGLLSQYSLSLPFWVASGVALLGVGVGLLLLPETLKERKTTSNQPLFNFHQLFKALQSPYVGSVLLISLIGSVAQNAWIIGFQTFTVDILKLSTQTIAYIFSLFGLLSIIMQGYGIRVILHVGKDQKRILSASLLGASLIMAGTFFIQSLWHFVGVIFLYAIVATPVVPVISSLISSGTKAEDQGGIMGVNQSYVSLGQIIGPLLAGFIATFNVSYVFLMVGVILLGAFGMSLRIGGAGAQGVQEKVDL